MSYLDKIINVRFHHGGEVIETEFFKYEGESGVRQWGIATDHFSLMEFNCYARELGYSIVEGYYFQETETQQFKLLRNDSQLLGLLVTYENGDFLDIFIKHVVDDSALMKNRVPTESIETDLNANSLGVDIGGSDLNDSNTDEDFDEEFDEDLEGIPDEDDSDVDEELRGFREKQRHEKREKLKKKEKSVTQEIELREVGIDKGFEDFQQRKRYIGKLAGDEEYLDSSDIGSDDSKDALDSQAEIGVDLPARTRSKKVRYDFDCKVAILKLRMIFESAVELRKIVADYVIQNKAQLKLRPNEKQRVRNQSGVSIDIGQSSTSSAQHNDTQASATTPIVSMTSKPYSICEDILRVEKSQAKSAASMLGRGTRTGIGTGTRTGGGIPTSSLGLEVGGGKARSMGANSSVTTASTVAATVSQYVVGATRSKVQGYGVYNDIRTRASIFNQGMSSERVLTRRLLKNATDINVDLGFQPHGLKWKGKKAITTSQLQHHRNMITASIAEVESSLYIFVALV
ncbi:hypothetical protein HAX54_046308 [Datura stramonium]|uniref:PB1-like domain-containing protein n=1 Tax=Datura stramonium TaxID=4076 RepID=A0ABS8SRV8_DATST|nr:hypothetical protein [Datura stramonium]